MKLRSALATAAALGLAAVPLATFRVDAGPVAESTVAVLVNDDYNDAGPIADGGEALNVVEDLEAGGHTVRQFSDISAAGLATALDGADVLAIPELEAELYLYEDLTADAADVITSFVDGGGRVVLFYAPDAADGLNDLFGFAVSDAIGCEEADTPERVGAAAAPDDPCLLTAAAADTEFADGPVELPGVDATSSLLTSSLPAGSTVIYESDVEQDEGGQPTAAAIENVAGVVSVPYGDGAIIALGWDWYPDSQQVDEEPLEETGQGVGAASVEDEAAWIAVLDFAVSQPEVTVATNTDGDLVFTSDSPSTQPVFVALTINGVTQTVTIAPKTTTATVDPAVSSATSASFSVPGWGIGEGSVQVGGTTAVPPGPRPVVANPSFTG